MKYLFTILLSAMASLAIADDVYNVPFTDSFDANTKRDQYTTIDANGDGVTFKRHYQTSILPGFYPDVDFEEMEYGSGSASIKADDWFITPKIHLVAGNVYSFSFAANVSFDSYTQVVEVCLGNDDTAEAMTTQLIPQTTVSSSTKHTFSNEFSVDATGDYRFGIHVTSEPDHGSLYFDDISIKMTSSTNVPAQVTDFTVTPDAGGALKALLRFTTPVKNIDGTDVGGITKVEVLRGDRLIGTITNVEPGQQVEWTDNSPKNGLNDYTVVAYNANGKGLRAIVKDVYVGVDTPLPPEDFTLTDNGNSILLTWGDCPAKGVHGMVVRPEDVVYYVQETNSRYEGVNLLAETREHSVSMQYDTMKGGQDLKRFSILCYNDAGWSDDAYARMVVGAPYNLPYSESFATGASHGLLWQEGLGTFVVNSDDSSDGDAGCMTFTPLFEGESVSLNLGKMNLKQALHPVMSFKYKGDATITVRTQNMDGTIKEYCTLQGNADEWQMMTVDLQPVAGQTYIIPKFFVEGKYHKTVALDDICLKDLYDYDLSLTIDEAHYDSEKGSVVVAYTVVNEGLTNARSFSVVTSVGSASVTDSVDESLAAGHVYNGQAEIPVKEYGVVEVKSVVVYAFDLYNDNNAASVKLAIDNAPSASSDADGIDVVEMRSSAGDAVYSIDGRYLGTDVNSLARGIYIIGGKKCVKR